MPRQMIWKDDLDDDGKPWRSQLILLFKRRYPCNEEWLAKIVRLRDPSDPARKAVYDYTVHGVSGGKAKTMHGARIACLRMLLRRAQEIIKAMGGKVIPPKK